MSECVRQTRLDIAVTVPIRAVSEANRSQREHWSSVNRRVKKTREAVFWFLYAATLTKTAPPHGWPVAVKVVRVAPRRLDAHDNLRSACKSVVDEVALWLRLTTDADPRVTWDYDQRRGRAGEYAVEITIKEAAP